MNWVSEVKQAAKEADAIILAHNYQIPEIQDVADFVGDSLALARKAADVTESKIVFCGVHFMAETAKILNPTKTVLIPDARAGCSLADSITAAELVNWKRDFPDAVVVSYVNTTAEVKALTDICCTSSNAVDVVNSIPLDKEILFLPDQFLGAFVKEKTGRQNMQIWAGECHVHAAINGSELVEKAESEPEADLYIHPECGCATSSLYLSTELKDQSRVHMLSTGGMLTAAENVPRSGKVLVATETGMLHQLRKKAPKTEFIPVSERAVCPYMKMINKDNLLATLQGTAGDEVFVAPSIADAARSSVEKMIKLGS